MRHINNSRGVQHKGFAAQTLEEGTEIESNHAPAPAVKKTPGARGCRSLQIAHDPVPNQRKNNFPAEKNPPDTRSNLAIPPIDLTAKATSQRGDEKFCVEIPEKIPARPSEIRRRVILFPPGADASELASPWFTCRRQACLQAIRNARQRTTH